MEYLVNFYSKFGLSCIHIYHFGKKTKTKLASCNLFSGVRLASGGKLHAEDKPQETAIFLVLVILQLTGSTGFNSVFVDV